MLLFFFPLHGIASNDHENEGKKTPQRFALYHKMETISHIPWYYYAAIDQYERSIRKARKDRESTNRSIAIYVPPDRWAGPLNPKQNDTNPLTISIFGGIGVDGNGDGKAERTNSEDLLHMIAQHLKHYGTSREDIKIGLWEYYQRDQTVRMIMSHAKVYKQIGQPDTDQHTFPIPKRYNYDYDNTWGDPRGWGGRRIHEGTDIFANYGVPVRATSYGVVEMKGWNEYGGWRIGIRDLNNVYHYFAHLKGYEKGIEKGTVVKPGDVIGYVGSSGYGPPGTQGKFPPHLHYGMYKDNGSKEWSFDPFPHLRAWERQGS